MQDTPLGNILWLYLIFN